VTDVNGAVLPLYDTVCYFDQFIDHENPSKGTFKQRYWTTSEFYKPGGSVVMLTPGETSVNGESTSPLYYRIARVRASAFIR